MDLMGLFLEDDQTVSHRNIHSKSWSVQSLCLAECNGIPESKNIAMARRSHKFVIPDV
jgi:hypothetical protein